MLAAIGYRMLPEIGKRKEQLARVEHLNAQIEKERQILIRNTREEHLLKYDREYLAMIVRDRFNLMRPTETIYRLDGEGIGVGARR